jgi:TonB family protein
VAALIVADTWSGDRAASHRAWAAAGDMAGMADQASMRTDIATALARIAALDEEHARTDGALPSVRGGATRWKSAVIDFKTCAYPAYPVESLRNEETGKVSVSFLVGLDGSVQRARKIASSGHARLDNEAMLSLANCYFRPATLDGRTVAAWQPVQYVWTLE